MGAFRVCGTADHYVVAISDDFVAIRNCYDIRTACYSRQERSCQHHVPKMWSSQRKKMQKWKTLNIRLIFNHSKSTSHTALMCLAIPDSHSTSYQLQNHKFLFLGSHFSCAKWVRHLLSLAPMCTPFSLELRTFVQYLRMAKWSN